MKNFIITSDSSCDLGKKRVDAIDVRCAHLLYNIDGVEYSDDMIEEHINEFYEKMEAGAMPKTSQISPQGYANFFKSQLGENLPILHISLSSGVSGTINSARIGAEIVKEEYPDADIRIIDSTVGSAALGILLYAAAKYRDKGRCIEEAVNHIEAIKENVNLIATTDDLTYLRRGGRVSSFGAAASALLKISPFLTLSKHGKLHSTAKARGRKAADEKFCSLVADSVVKPQKQTLFIVHANALERAKSLGEALKHRLGFKAVEYVKFGTVIGSHAGPGLIAACFFGKTRSVIL